jgi:flagellar biosynthetic protein FliP
MSRRLAHAGCLALLLPAAAWAARGASPASGLDIGKTGSMSAPMQIVLLLTALTLLPAALVSVTPFLRISVVLHFLRQALATQTAPSNQVLVGLALFLSLLSIEPMASQIYEQAWRPPGRCASSGCASPARKTSLCCWRYPTRRRRALRPTWI